MDEFCANKDSQLKRCACSARATEFDDVQAQLSAAEDKLLDFSQRLLTVSMDKEDAEALYQATEGELAFNQEDTSASKKLLDEIANKLNTTFDTSNFDTNLSPISLGLNVDAAFDNLDSLSGASTTAKSGTALYSAALPVCREMAMEVCTESELAIAESGYQMLIEQDCNTVARAYETQKNQTREQILESSALLDMSRLNDYQTRNSDDILTCKRKMLDMLSSTSVCGENLEQCLDISGRYIDPSTGEAILTSNLVNLGHLITRPTGNQLWTDVPGNEKFVSYLDSKKMFLESATENCEDIAPVVWDQFVEDALAQIKLAQDKKLEEVRQSCTTLTTQCLSDAAESLEDFDARALSIFGVDADKTVKQMCAQIQTACTALLDEIDAGDDWSSGMTEIATDKTYDTIMKTCREVGRNCIIQSCKAISGNFGLCTDIQTSVNRKSIINRTACWNEVVDCVRDAGDDAIAQITELLGERGIVTETADDGVSGPNYYSYLYGISTPVITSGGGTASQDDGTATQATGDDAAEECKTGTGDNCIYDICYAECREPNSTSPECLTCRMAESIWGNCELAPNTILDPDEHNRIKIPETDQEATLMAWFAKNTNTADAIDSCRDTSCGPGYILIGNQCRNTANILDDGYCPSQYGRITVTAGDDPIQNCCVIYADDKHQTINDTDEGEIWPDTDETYPTTCCLGAGTLGNNFQNITPNGPPSGHFAPLTSSSRVCGDEGKDACWAQAVCIPMAKNVRFVLTMPKGKNDKFRRHLVCVSDGTNTDNILVSNDPEPVANYPSGKNIKCNGRYVFIETADDTDSNFVGYYTPQYQDITGCTPETETVIQYPKIYYRTGNGLDSFEEVIPDTDGLDGTEFEFGPANKSWPGGTPQAYLVEWPTKQPQCEPKAPETTEDTP